MKTSPPSTALCPRHLRCEDLLSIDHPLRPWPPSSRVRLHPVVRLLVFGAVFGLLAVGVSATITAMMSTHPELHGRGPMWWELGLIFSAVVGYLLLVAGWERRPVHELAWQRAPVGLAFGIAVGGGLIATSVGVLAIGGVYRVSGINSSYDPWFDLLVLGVGAGVVEEIVFRGVGQRLLEEWIGTWAAIGVSSVAFGAGHLANPQATWQGVVAIAVEAGVLLGALYALTRSLWVVIGCHLAWNVVQGPVFGLVVSGATTGEGWLIGRLSGPDWATGGVFGLEASWVTVLVATMAGIVASVALHRSGQVVAPVWVRRRVVGAGPASDAESGHSR